jgi:hypothetical protein
MWEELKGNEVTPYTSLFQHISHVEGVCGNFSDTGPLLFIH